MNTREEIGLLIKSRYPLLFLETADEDYSMAQLKELAGEQNLVFFRWSITGGLVRGENKTAYYQSAAPGIALKAITDLLVKPQPLEAGLYVMKDITAHLDDQINLRLCKDILKQIKNRRDTLIFLSHTYNLPKELETAAVHIACGFPDIKEVRKLIVDSVAEISRWHEQVTVKLDDSEIDRLVNAFKGLTLQQIKNALHQAALDNNRLCIEDLVLIEKYKRRIYDQAGILEFYPLEEEERIGRFHSLKKWLSQRKESFNPALFYCCHCQ